MVGTENHRDLYFNSPQCDFRKSDEALRIRIKEEGARLTYKGPKLDSQTKSRLELTVHIDNPEEMVQILEALGFGSRRRSGSAGPSTPWTRSPLPSTRWMAWAPSWSWRSAETLTGSSRESCCSPCKSSWAWASPSAAHIWSCWKKTGGVHDRELPGSGTGHALLHDSRAASGPGHHACHFRQRQQGLRGSNIRLQSVLLSAAHPGIHGVSPSGHEAWAEMGDKRHHTGLRGGEHLLRSGGLHVAGHGAAADSWRCCSSCASIRSGIS